MARALALESAVSPRDSQVQEGRREARDIQSLSWAEGGRARHFLRSSNKGRTEPRAQPRPALRPTLRFLPPFSPKTPRTHLSPWWQ
jgi:hypothetical protein